MSNSILQLNIVSYSPIEFIIVQIIGLHCHVKNVILMVFLLLSNYPLINYILCKIFLVSVITVVLFQYGFERVA